MGEGSKYIREVDDLLTLEGLRIIYERNQAHAERRSTARAIRIDNTARTSSTKTVEFSGVLQGVSRSETEVDSPRFRAR